MKRRKRTDGRPPLHAEGRNRRGAVLVVALVCLGVAAALLGSLLRSAARESRQWQFDQNWRQAVWLVESGRGRAAHHLAADPDYEGETWRIEAGELGGRLDGLVTILVEPIEQDVATNEAPADGVPDAASLRRVTVTVEYPAGAPQAAKRTRHGTIHVSPDFRRAQE